MRNVKTIAQPKTISQRTGLVGLVKAPSLCNPVLALALGLASLVPLVCELVAGPSVLDEPAITAVEVTVDPSMELAVDAALEEVDGALGAFGAEGVITIVDVTADPAASVLVVVIMLVVLETEEDDDVDDEFDADDEPDPEAELALVLLLDTEDAVDEDVDETDVDAEPDVGTETTPPASEENKAVVALPAIPFQTMLTTSPSLAVTPGPRYESVEPLTTPRAVLPGTWYAATVLLPSVRTAMPVVADAGTGPKADVVMGVPSRLRAVEPAEKTWESGSVYGSFAEMVVDPIAHAPLPAGVMVRTWPLSAVMIAPVAVAKAEDITTVASSAAVDQVSYMFRVDSCCVWVSRMCK